MTDDHPPTTDWSGAYGPWALVLGAGAGLGEAYARELSARGLELVLVDRDATALTALAASLGADRCRCIELDLAASTAAAELTAAVAELDVGLVVANAAASFVGRFRDHLDPLLTPRRTARGDLEPDSARRR
ncbi:MAG: SDR family NAD(P)-dependent oxidoreductase [Acidimicrobiales bacterium]|nr:SDR family NAD(P)-dependent oxidoreductase [Acidimicrobiales bacterium]